MNRPHHKIIFIALTYRNVDDIKCFLSNSIVQNYHTIVVNSYFDKETDSQIKDLAKKHSADFISVENKGYGYGNNQGIEYALKHYTFEALVICNPDTIIKDFTLPSNDILTNSILGPDIIAKNNRHQNPYYAYANPIAEILFKQYAKSAKKRYFWIGIILNKILREFFRISFMVSKKKVRKVNALHGAFFIIGKNALSKMPSPIFDERIFLFTEEKFIARDANRRSIPMLYTKNIIVNHKEDGSINLSNVNVMEHYIKSLRIYYNIDNNRT